MWHFNLPGKWCAIWGRNMQFKQIFNFPGWIISSKAPVLLLHYQCTSPSINGAACLQYAALWVIALWIACVCVWYVGARVCVCMHVLLCLFFFFFPAVLGKIRSAVGSAQLLMSQKFQQFRELCEENLVCVTSSSACRPSVTPSPSLHWHHPAQIMLTGQTSSHLVCIQCRHSIYSIHHI